MRFLVKTHAPDAVVVGRGLAQSTGPYAEHFLAAHHRHLSFPEQGDLPFLRAATGSDAGWIGAAAKASIHLNLNSNQANV